MKIRNINSARVNLVLFGIQGYAKTHYARLSAAGVWRMLLVHNKQQALLSQETFVPRGCWQKVSARYAGIHRMGRLCTHFRPGDRSCICLSQDGKLSQIRGKLPDECIRI